MDTYITNATRQCNACVVEQEREGKQSVGGEKKKVKQKNDIQRV